MLDALSHRIRSPGLGSLAAVLAAHALLIGVMTLQGQPAGRRRCTVQFLSAALAPMMQAVTPAISLEVRGPARYRVSNTPP